MNEESAKIDMELLGLIAQGDRAAFSRCYDRYSGILFSIIVKVLNDSKEAEDVLQEVFLQIWDKAAVYKRELGAPFSWFVTMTRNKAIDRLRTAQRRYRLLDEVKEETAILLKAAASSKSETESNETSVLVRTAVSSLPGDQRQAIELAFFGGMTQNEISVSLGEPLGTVKARIRRGMLKLRDSLEGQI
ncbi:MAG: sigma-70 family RNA polymerase sigma factor [Verrucomicrobiota bacterium]